MVHKKPFFRISFSSAFSFPKKWNIALFVMLFVFPIQGNLMAQFIGADFQYSVHTVAIDDTVSIDASEAPPVAVVLDPNAPVTYKVTLKLYFDCFQEDFSPTQPISVHESMATMQTAQVALELDSVSTNSEYLNVSCEMASEQCLKVASYSGYVEVSNLYGGYDMTWGICCWDFSVSNLDNLKMQGLSLVLHLPYQQAGQSNSSPVFVRNPQTLTCPDKIMNINGMAIDRDGDVLSYQLIQPTSFEQEQNIGNANHGDLFPGQNAHKPLLVGRPPFKNVAYADGFGFKNPMGEAPFTINTETGSLDLEPKQAGRYLIGYGVTETRNGEVLGEVQRVYLFEVLSNPVQNVQPTIPELPTN